MFSQKPQVACVNCNTRWMKAFEDEMLKFAIPIFTGERPIILDQYQIRVFAVWLSLITILSQYTDNHRESVVTTQEERDYLMRHRKPPDHWSIFAASQDVFDANESWKIRYKAHIFNLRLMSDSERPAYRPLDRIAPNSQIATFGMGKIFVQTFVCPPGPIVMDYRVAAKAAGLIPIWPMPLRLWPFTKGQAKLPTKLVLNNESAEIVSEAFRRRTDVLYQAGTGLTGKMR